MTVTGTSLALVCALTAAAAEESRSQRAREEIERELKQMVNIPAPRLQVVLEPLDEPNFALVDAELTLDGAPLPVTLLGVTLPKSHTLYSAEVAPGMHTLMVRVIYEDASSVVMSESAGYKWKVPLRVELEARKGLEVVVKLFPSRVPSKDPKEQLKLKAAIEARMLAPVDDRMPEPLARPSPPDAGTEETPEQKAARLAEEKRRKEEERRLAKQAALEEKRRKEEERRLAKQAALEEKRRKAEERRLAKQAALEEKRRKAEERRLAKQAALAEKRRLAEASTQAKLAHAQAGSGGSVEPAGGSAPGEVVAAEAGRPLDAGVAEAYADAGIAVAEAEPVDAGVPVAPVATAGAPSTGLGPMAWGALGLGAVVLLGLVAAFSARWRRQREMSRISDEP